MTPPPPFKKKKGNGTEEKGFNLKRKVFKDELKELTEAELWTETGVQFRVTGAW